MKKADVFPNKYAKAVDLEGQSVTVTIQSCEFEKFNDDRKMVLSFKELDKKLILNKTNYESIEKALGTDDSDEWPGNQITLYPEVVAFRGDNIETVRIRPAAPPTPVAIPEEGEITDADIPF